MQTTIVTAPFAATVVQVRTPTGSTVRAGDTLIVLEVMKMEHPVAATVNGTVREVTVAVGDPVEVGSPLLTLVATPVPGPASGDAPPADAHPTAPPAVLDGSGPVRDDLTEVLRRRTALTDEARPDAVARRHDAGHRTARENVADLMDPASFSEYGGLAIAAQRSRRSLEELIERTPADGLITGIGTVNAHLFGAERAAAAVAAYDYTVLAGTQGWANHHKKDRLFRLAWDRRLPVVVFAEGGGGRPGDTDVVGGSWLDAEAFALFARLVGRVPTVAVVNGRCFAGNAALAGTADVIIATAGSSLGMAGPAMIEGGGLGEVHPDEVGPMAVQVGNGVVDVLVDDEAAAVDVVRRYLAFAQGDLPAPEPHEQSLLRDAVPANRKQMYDVRALVETLCDPDSILELRAGHAPGMLTAFGRIGGRAVGVLANLPTHLGGAIDAEGADSATRHLELCEAYGLPVLVLCDTPGFMVGPEAERDGGVRRFSRMFTAGARLTVPLICIVTRKGYGLGAQAMMGGHLRMPVATLAWPTAELGPMGLEGAVKLGFRRELEAIADEAERDEQEAAMVELAHAHARGLNVATFGEIDDVIDPADTRLRILQTLATITRRGIG